MMIPKVGLVNGLAVYGPNTGTFEIEVTVIPAKEKGTLILQELLKRKVLGPREIDSPKKYGKRFN